MIGRLFGNRDPESAVGRIGDAIWSELLEAYPLFDGFGQEQLQRLRRLAERFLDDKVFFGARGFEPELEHCIAVAAQAVLPVLELGYEWLEGWHEVVLYPAEFIVEGEAMDENGLVHRFRDIRAGEAWQSGRLVLSWNDVWGDGSLDGYNVVIHEIAHKLDERDGALDGTPPLHRDIDRQAWIDHFTQAFEELHRILEADAEPFIDPYAAESPAECFAVFSEAFFETPDFLSAYYGELYGVLRAFYRQDPLLRFGSERKGKDRIDGIR